MEGPESFLRNIVTSTYTAVLMYPAHSGFSHYSLSLTSHISHQHEQKEEAFARGEIFGGEDPWYAWLSRSYNNV